MGFHGRAAASKPYRQSDGRIWVWWLPGERYLSDRIVPSVTFELRGDYGVGLFFWSWAWPLSSSERNSECFSIPRDFRQFHAPNFGVEELDWPAQSPDLNPIEHLWNELERRLRARPFRPTSVSDLTNALLQEWPKIPINTLLNLVESLTRRVEAVMAAKGGKVPMSY